MANLSADCLLYIFEWLPMDSIIISEQVCKFWRVTVQVYWSRCQKLKLHVDGTCSENDQLVFQHLKQTSNLFSLQIEERTNPHAEGLAWLPLTSSFLPHLRELILINIRINDENLSKIASTFHGTLRIFHLDYFIGTHEQYREYPNKPNLDQGLSILFDSCSLEKVFLRLDRLPKAIHFKGLKGLKSLSLSTRFYRAEFFDFFFDWLSSIASGLEHLSLDLCFDHNVSDWFSDEIETGSYLSRIWERTEGFQSLRLNLTEYYRREEFPIWGFLRKSLPALPAANQLRNISLRNYEGLESRDVAAVVEHCAELREFHLVHAKIGRETALASLRNAPKLELLDLSHCMFYNKESHCYNLLSNASLQPLFLIRSLKELRLDGQIGLSAGSVLNFLLDECLPTNAEFTRISAKDTFIFRNESLWQIFATLQQLRPRKMLEVGRSFNDENEASFADVMQKSGIVSTELRIRSTVLRNDSLEKVMFYRCY